MLVASRMTCKPLLALVLSAAAVRPAHAEAFLGEPGDPGYESESPPSLWHDPTVTSGIGIGVHIGGGVTGFTDSVLRATTSSVGGLWSARGVFGTRTLLALEVGYVGTVHTIESQLGPQSATLLGTTLEAALRYNALPRSPLTPYLFAGMGWQRYSIDDKAFEVSDTGIARSDDLLVLPAGGGLAYRVGSIIADLRGTFRATRDQNLVLEAPRDALRTGNGRFAPMHTWDASLNVGYEF